MKPTYYLVDSDFDTEELLLAKKQFYEKCGFKTVIFKEGKESTAINVLQQVINNHNI